MSTLERAIISFEIKIQRKEIHSSFQLATEALKVLSICVSCSNSKEEVEQDIIKTSARLRKCAPYDVVINNCCTRVIEAINEEMNKTIPQFDQLNDIRRSHSVSLLELFATPLVPTKSSSFDEDPSFKSSLKMIIQDYIDEIPQYYQGLSKKAPEFIHNGDVILTIGYSQSTISFLRRAKEKHRKFSVMIPEHAPANDGITLAAELRKSGIEVIIIPDAAVFAVMPKISTVIIPCRGVLADGNLICTNYVLPIVMAANHHSVPVVVLYWKWKLTERFLKPGDSFTQLTSPSDVIKYNAGGQQTIFNPEGEIVPGHYIKIFINEEGPHGRADIFPLMQSIYHNVE